jgi:cytosine/adenosine deaminase-related metal-dependent hydrolase
LAPGLVNAHVHLELSFLAGRLSSGVAFRAWLDELLASRNTVSEEARVAAARDAADRLLQTGTTLVGDIAAGTTTEVALERHALLRVHYREVLDGGVQRRAARALETVSVPLLPRDNRLEGLAPHAPYSTSTVLLKGAGAIARRRALPLAIHWAETDEENRWMEGGRGPLKGLVKDPPHCSSLDHLDRAGLLGPRLALIHGNHPGPADRERVAAAGASLVHCPGSHRWFGRELFDIEAWTRAGVNLALGTDSLASNTDLDMTREMALLREDHPELSPERVWEMATTGGARALGLGLEAGTLVPGARADLCAWPRGVEAVEDFLEAVTQGECHPLALWILGERQRSSGDA